MKLSEKIKNSLNEKKGVSAFDVLEGHYTSYFKELEKSLKKDKSVDKVQLKIKKHRFEFAVTGYNRSDFEVSVVIFFKVFDNGNMSDAIKYDVVVSRPDADDLIKTVNVGFNQPVDLESFILQQFR